MQLRGGGTKIPLGGCGSLEKVQKMRSCDGWAFVCMRHMFQIHISSKVLTVFLGLIFNVIVPQNPMDITHKARAAGIERVVWNGLERFQSAGETPV